MTTSIPISGLNDITSVETTDFFPLVRSGSALSLTTFRASISELNNWFAASGSCLSASWASSSISSSYSLSSSYAVSASQAASASYSVSSSYSVFTSQAASASYAVTASFSNGSLSSSLSVSSSTSISSSYAITASYAVSASTALNSLSSISASYALSASYAVSCSVATTASYAITASYASSSTNPFTLISTNNALPVIGGFTAGNSYNLSISTSGGSWNTISLSGIVPPGTRYARLYMIFGANNSAGAYQFLFLRTSATIDPLGHVEGGPYGGNQNVGYIPTETLIQLTPSLTFDYFLTGVGITYNGSNMILTGYI